MSVSVEASLSSDQLRLAAERDFATSNYEAALQAYRSLPSSSDCAADQLQMAKCCKYLARPREAVEHCNRALKDRVKWKEAFLLRSSLFQALHQQYLSSGEEELDPDRSQWRREAQFVVNAALEADQNEPGTEGPWHLRRLDRALSLAKDGDVIFVEPGSYEASALDEEGVASPCFIHGKNVSIIGSSQRDCVIEYKEILQERNSTAKKLNTFLICATESNKPTLIKNITFRNLNLESNGTNTKFLGVAAGHVLIESCLFDGLECNEVDAIFSNQKICGNLAKNYPPPNLEIRLCIFDHCQSYAAITVTGATVLIDSCLFLGSNLVVNDRSEVQVVNSEFAQTGNRPEQTIRASKSKLLISGTYIHGIQRTLTAFSRKSLGISLTLNCEARIENCFLYLCSNGIACQESNLVCQNNLIFHCAKRFSEIGLSSLGLEPAQINSTLGLYSAISLTSRSKYQVSDNHFKKCDIGVYIGNEAMPTLKSNHFESSLFTGMFVQGRSKPNILGNTFVGTTHEPVQSQDCGGIGILLIMEAAGLIGKNSFQNYDLSPLMVFRTCHPMLKGNQFDNINLDREKQAQTEEKMKLLFQPESLKNDTYFYIVESELGERELYEEILNGPKT
ncbi:hypothetical protein TCAL_16601 [Tigriopus californicus]|uniref:Right handed beta helix domain-containing protein n=1 Tax=Tigriopus californicus TaxID=6832 RepID=A0A553NDG2_TIGCA|nr:uncharacterized protein LOC131888823 [Tigriopus californicus]TRY63448.1 hypothetical protein TCAL_16601 [Tigriopus californicus]